jgi:cell wall-associated NlpC family hydrolase
MQTAAQSEIVARARECVGAMWGGGEGQFDAWGLVAHVLGRPLELERRGWGPEALKDADAALVSMGLRRVAKADARPGDVLLFDMPPAYGNGGGFHVAILTDTSGVEWQAIHAAWGRAVSDAWVGHWVDGRRYAGAYRPVAPASDVAADLAEAA